MSGGFATNPVIQRIRQERETIMAGIDAKAQMVWEAMDANQKLGVRFGLFPVEVIAKAETEMGWSPQVPGKPDPYAEEKEDLCIAMMNCASKDGGMRA
jgi:hypothetical protein